MGQESLTRFDQPKKEKQHKTQNWWGKCDCSQ
jgi:hypothetical protein